MIIREYKGRRYRIEETTDDSAIVEVWRDRGRRCRAHWHAVPRGPLRDEVRQLVTGTLEQRFDALIQKWAQ